MEIKQIEPVKMVTRLYGHEIEIVVTGSTHPEIPIRVEDATTSGDIVKGLSGNLCHGQLNGVTRIVPDAGTGEAGIRLEGNWRIIPDYSLWRRIFSWWYCHGFDEALSPGDFQKYFGNWKGRHYFDHWVSSRRDIPKMIGYIGNNMEEGRTFLDMVMQKVRQFEERINGQS